MFIDARLRVARDSDIGFLWIPQRPKNVNIPEFASAGRPSYVIDFVAALRRAAFVLRSAFLHRGEKVRAKPAEVSGRRTERRLVLEAGLEPARLAPHAPQACVSTNSTTRAIRERRGFRGIRLSGSTQIFLPETIFPAGQSLTLFYLSGIFPFSRSHSLGRFTVSDYSNGRQPSTFI